MPWPQEPRLDLLDCCAALRRLAAPAGASATRRSRHMRAQMAFIGQVATQEYKHERKHEGKLLTRLTNLFLSLVLKMQTLG